MEYKLTNEQNSIINLAVTHCNEKKPILIKVEAVAGAAKTTTLTEISFALAKTLHIQYLAYNKSIATEADTKFPANTECRTTHSLAYEPVIKYGLDIDGKIGKSRRVGWFGVREIGEPMPYSLKMSIVQHLEAFFLSRFLSVRDYFDSLEPVEPELIDYCEDYFNKMVNKEIEVTHAFYLKFFHILLANECIHYDTYDVLMLDEAGDVNAVTYEIFMLLPAIVKIMVGDSQQNIYSFNHTINAFEYARDIGVTMHLTQSFRCSTRIADMVQRFSQAELDENMIFKGTDHDSLAINTTAYLTRTNSGLLHYIIKFMQEGKLFTLVRNPNEIFKTVLNVLAANNGKTIKDAQYKFLEWDIREFNTNARLKLDYNNSPLKYLLALHSEDRDIQTAITTIFKYGGKNIWDAFQYAKKMFESKTTASLYLTTVHSSKGLTFDEVIIGDDFNVKDILETDHDCRLDEEQEELRLVYVALTRSRVSIKNHEQFYFTGGYKS